MKELTTKQTVFILSSMLAVVILCVFLSSAFATSTSSYQPDPELARRIGKQQGEEAIQATEEFIDDILQTKGASSSDAACGALLYEALQRNNLQYRIVITMNANDTPYPFRDVPDVRLNIEFPDATTAYLWYYAGVLNTCELRGP